MKKIKKGSLFKRLPYAYLYLEDIESIVEAIKAHSFRIVFSDDQYEYESLEEMKDKVGSRVRKISIIGIDSEHFRHFSLDIVRRDIYLSGDAENELLEGVK